MRSIQQTVQRRQRQDRWFRIVGASCTLVGVVTLVALLGNLLLDGLARIDWNFLSSFPSRRAAAAGILAALVGSLLVMVVTAVVAVPLGIAAGVYLEEYAPKNRLLTILEVNIANLAGVPSVVYGLMALGVFVYTFGFGHSIATAGLTLAALILPIVIVATREALRTIPRTIREASYALGATKWEVSWDIVLPYTRSAVIGGVFLGLGRALGETMAVAFVIGNNVQFTKSLLEPSTTIAALIANDFGEATAEYRSALLLLGFVLFIVTFAVLAVARAMLQQLARKEGN